MKSVLYLTYTEVPYRTKFFNALSKYVDLSVLYEKRITSFRNKDWCNSVERKYNVKCIDKKYWFEAPIKFLNLFRILYCSKYDYIIIGCYNTIFQMYAILLLRIFKKKFIINLDGEQFFDNTFFFKNLMKKFFLKGANKYLIAGMHSANKLKSQSFIDPFKVVSYNFSSLTNEEIRGNSSKKRINTNNNVVLVVGRYFPYKGLDIAVKVARMNKDIQYIFVGMGNRTKKFIQDFSLYKEPNIKVLSFLQHDELEKLYLKSDAFLLPSKKECWGLVINEAASYGVPIVSTDGSGAAIEFLKDSYPEFLAKRNDVEELYCKLCDVLNADKKYSSYLIRKASEYSIESMVETHCKLFNEKL